MIERKLFESIGNSQNIIISWKWGVWKSTVSASLALYYSQQALKVIAVDMDAAHSLWDSLWLDINWTKTWTFSIDYNENLKLYFLSQIIPDLYNDPKHEKLNIFLDNLVDIEDSFLPLLRLAIHPSFVWMPLPHENAAYVLQLIELFRKNTIYKIDDKASVKKIFEWSFEKRIIDSENTKWLIRVINSILSIQNTLQNINKSFYWTTIQKLRWTVTREAIKNQDNLHKLAQSDLVLNYKDYIWDVVWFHTEIVKASVILVTQPWYNDLNQTLTEIKQLIRMWIVPKHILVNKFRDHFDKDSMSTQKIYDELKKSFEWDNIWISPIDSRFNILNPWACESEKKEITRINLENIAKTFV